MFSSNSDDRDNCWKISDDHPRVLFVEEIVFFCTNSIFGNLISEIQNSEMLSFRELIFVGTPYNFDPIGFRNGSGLRPPKRILRVRFAHIHTNVCGMTSLC